MKRIGLVLAAILLSANTALAQTSLSFGISRTSLSAVAGGAGTIGTAFTAPPGGDAALVTWATSYSAPPASVTMLLQASLDNSTWFTLDSSTAVGGEIRNIATSASFFRCNISAVSGAVNKTCSFVLRRTNSATQGTSFAGDITAGGEFFASNGTAGAPSYSFTSEPTLGFYRSSASNVTLSGIFTANQINVAGAGYIRWTGQSEIRSPVDGNIRLANAAQTDFGLLQFGGTTNAFPALKRVGGLISVRTADDSAAAAMLMSTLYASGWEGTPGTFAALGTPTNGNIKYCSDCTITPVCAGAGTGAFAKRLNGVWVCN